METETILRENFRKRIEWQHCIDIQLKIPVNSKKSISRFDLALIGRSYDSRLFALQQLRNVDLKLNSFHGTHGSKYLIDRIIKKIGREMDISSEKLHHVEFKLNYYRQQVQYLQSSAAWMDPGYFGYFVRKYLESSVMGCALVGEFNSRIGNLGFENGANCQYIRTENILKSKSTEFIRDRNLHRFLSANAINLVETSHSTQVRARQISAALANNRTNAVSRFRSGKFVTE